MLFHDLELCILNIVSVATHDNTQVVFSVVFNWPIALQEIINTCKYKPVPLKLIKQQVRGTIGKYIIIKLTCCRTEQNTILRKLLYCFTGAHVNGVKGVGRENHIYVYFVLCVLMCMFGGGLYYLINLWILNLIETGLVNNTNK